MRICNALAEHSCLHLSTCIEYVSGLNIKKKTDQGMWSVWLWVRHYLRECVSANTDDQFSQNITPTFTDHNMK